MGEVRRIAPLFPSMSGMLWRSRHRAVAARDDSADCEGQVSRRWSVTQDADRLGTPGHLATLVRLSVGRTPRQVIADRTLIEAKRLLAYPAESVGTGADQLGFHDTSQFSRWFRNNRGFSPKSFRSAAHDAPSADNEGG